MANSYSEAYAEARARVEALAGSRADRALAPHEQAGIRNAGSVMSLEVLERALEDAPDAGSVAYVLGHWAARAAEQVEHARSGFSGLAAHLLGRELTAPELAVLSAYDDVLAVIRLGEALVDAAPHDCEQVLASYLAGDQNPSDQ